MLGLACLALVVLACVHKNAAMAVLASVVTLVVVF